MTIFIIAYTTNLILKLDKFQLSHLFIKLRKAFWTAHMHIIYTKLAKIYEVFNNVFSKHSTVVAMQR